MAKQETLDQTNEQAQAEQATPAPTQFSELEARYQYQIAEANADPLRNGFVGFVTKSDGSVERVDRFGAIEIVAHMKVMVNQLGYTNPLIMEWSTKSGRFLSSEKYMQQAFPNGSVVKDTAVIAASQATTQLENKLHAVASSKVFSDKIRAALISEIVKWYVQLPGASVDEMYNLIEASVR